MSICRGMSEHSRAAGEEGDIVREGMATLEKGARVTVRCILRTVLVQVGQNNVCAVQMVGWPM
jgi:hypothetical protein